MRAVLLLCVPLLIASSTPPSRAAEKVSVNDNRAAAGQLRGGTLTLRLEARAGTWHPDGDSDPGAEVLALGEVGKPLQVPGPLIRVREGTEIHVTVRNATDTALTFHGLAARSADGLAPDDTVRIAPGGSHEFRFRATPPGTFHYWASSAASLALRPRRETLLGGALIVDRANTPASSDRVLVINVWGEPRPVRAEGELFRMVINGKAWPNTERMTYGVGDSVRWRVINGGNDVHPMHLHGFYFRVDSRGSERVDTVYDSRSPHMVVTERMAAGRTMMMTWVPERAGNWLFHCHSNFHIQTNQPLDPSASLPHSAHHEMGNLVMGIHVRGPAGDDRAVGRRSLRLIAREDSGSRPDAPSYGYVLEDPRNPSSRMPTLPGPAMVLRRGEPVTVTVVNQLPEETAVHWHGIELESYYDGVAGFAGAANRLAPYIAPRDSFAVRFTPPRAGTFIYHTHVNEIRQQRAGLSGPLIVLEPGARWDPSTDLVLMISTPRAEADQGVVLINGRVSPTPLELSVGTRYRLRIINIHTYRPAMRVEMKTAAGRIDWRAVAKDGADLPPALATSRPAFFPISNGETYDFEFTPTASGPMRLEVTAATGAVLAVQTVNVR